MSLPRLDPRDPVFQFSLGLARHRAGQFEEAAAALSEACRLKPDWPQAHYNLGIALNSAGRRSEAARAYRAALRLQPGYIHAEVNLANILKAEGKFGQAIAAYRRVLRRDPNLGEVHNNLGAALLADGDNDDAEAAFRTAIRLRSGFAEALANLAGLLVAAGRFAEAVPIAAAARRAAPERAAYCELHGDALRGAGEYGGAIAAYEAALALEPDLVSARFGMANAMRLNRDLAGAEAILRPLVGRFPNAWQTHHDLANVVRHKGDFTEAEAGYRRALALHESPATLWPLGMVLRDLQRLEESAAHLEKARRLAPRDENVAYNLAATYLTGGRLREGFALYDSRFAKFRPPKIVGKAWTNENVRGRTILVTAEQGFGDTLQFVRYVPLLSAAGARVKLRVQPALLRLLADFPCIDKVTGEDAALPAFDMHVPIMSLPHRLGCDEPMPVPVPYIEADPLLTAAWRARLAALPGLRVGLAWSGNSGFVADKFRSVAPASLSAFANCPGVSFVSLQKDAGVLPALALADHTACLADFADTAALMAALDLVISVDTSVAHLAGALGQKVWLLNRFDTCWRWLTGREDSIWYPTMRIFRQATPGDWAVPLAQAAACLRDRVGM